MVCFPRCIGCVQAHNRIQPPRSIPKVYQLLVKTHKLTIFHTVLPPTSVASIKADTLSALASDVNQADDVPQVSSVDDFELCRAVKDAKGNLTGEYLALDSSKQIKDFGLGGWDHLYIRFKDPDTGEQICGALLIDGTCDVTYSRPRQKCFNLSFTPNRR